MTEGAAARGLRILHVTEASGGGVLQVVTHLARHQQAVGAQVSVALTDRFDTPSQVELRSRLGPCEVRRLGGGSTLKRVWRLFRLVGRELSQSNFDVIHLHSSYAGLAGRLAVMTRVRRKVLVLYSAHAFAFLRSNQSSVSRRMIYAAESFLSRASDGTVAISESEAASARQLGAAKKVRLLANCIATPSPATPDNSSIVVANIGRLVPQKGPDRFAFAANHFKGRAKFVWIGGPTEATDRVLMSSSVHVTGQLPHTQALDVLRTATVHLFTSRWEGMPLALMESQAMGIPAIAWDCPGTSDVVLDGETGFLVRDESELIERLSEILDNRALWEKTSNKAMRMRERFSDDGYGQRSIELYEDFFNEVRVSKPKKAGR